MARSSAREKMGWSLFFFWNRVMALLIHTRGQVTAATMPSKETSTPSRARSLSPHRRPVARFSYTARVT